jgi:spore coat protein U-like protein
MRLRKVFATLTATLLASLIATSAASAACTISTTAVSFGNYDVFASSPLDAAGQVSFRCTGISPVSVTVTLDKGGAPTFNPRRLLQGGEALNYNLYRDAARTNIWGDGTGGTGTYTQLIILSLLGQTITVPVYGRIPASQNVGVGTYTNTVTATILF